MHWATGSPVLPSFERCARLRPGGAFAFNVVGTLDGSGAVRAVVRAAGSVFEDVRLVPVMTATERVDPAATRNVVVVGTS